MKNGPLPAATVGATQPQPAVRLALQARTLINDNVLSPWFATYTVWNAGSNAAACGETPTSTLGSNPMVPGSPILAATARLWAGPCGRWPTELEQPPSANDRAIP